MPEHRPQTVGFVGLGKMGLPMCRNLIKAGHRLAVHNRSVAKAQSLAADGVIVTTSPMELARSCDIIITCLNTIGASDTVFLGDDGLVANAAPGTLLIDHATITPTLAARIGQAAAARGLDFIDAPVSGGPEGASNGTLAIMAGATSAAFERGLPVMRAYGRTIQRMGDVGSGTHAKLVNQLLTFVHGAAAAEAIAFARRTGLDLEALGRVLGSSFGYSRMFERTLARVRAGDFEAGAALTLYDKDMTIVASIGDEHGLHLPLTAAARGILERAIGEELGALDIAALSLRSANDATTEGRESHA